MRSKTFKIIRDGRIQVGKALLNVAEMAQYLATTAPRPEAERGALLEVLSDAHIVLSLTEALHQLNKQAATRDRQKGKFSVLENNLTRAQANLATSQQVLTHSLVTKRKDRPNKTLKDQAIPKTRPLAPMLLFKKPR